MVTLMVVMIMAKMIANSYIIYAIMVDVIF